MEFTTSQKATSQKATSQRATLQKNKKAKKTFNPNTSLVSP